MCITSSMTLFLNSFDNAVLYILSYLLTSYVNGSGSKGKVYKYVLYFLKKGVCIVTPNYPMAFQRSWPSAPVKWVSWKSEGIDDDTLVIGTGSPLSHSRMKKWNMRTQFDINFYMPGVARGMSKKDFWCSSLNHLKIITLNYIGFLGFLRVPKSSLMFLEVS